MQIPEIIHLPESLIMSLSLRKDDCKKEAHSHELGVFENYPRLPPVTISNKRIKHALRQVQEGKMFMMARMMERKPSLTKCLQSHWPGKMLR
jgi:hypothetical protein